MRHKRSVAGTGIAGGSKGVSGIGYIYIAALVLMHAQSTAGFLRGAEDSKSPAAFECGRTFLLETDALRLSARTADESRSEQKPRRASASAAISPAGPAPITRRSQKA